MQPHPSRRQGTSTISSISPDFLSTGSRPVQSRTVVSGDGRRDQIEGSSEFWLDEGGKTCFSRLDQIYDFKNKEESTTPQEKYICADILMGLFRPITAILNSGTRTG